METETSTLGADFAAALTAKDFEAAGALFHPDVDFRALTPNVRWHATSPRQVVDEVLRKWLDDEVENAVLLDVQEDAVADRKRVGFRFSGLKPDGPFLCEQQAFYSERDGKIDWMRLVCSGMRRVD